MFACHDHIAARHSYSARHVVFGPATSYRVFHGFRLNLSNGESSKSIIFVSLMTTLNLTVADLIILFSSFSDFCCLF
jgi:hypothetical protein